MIQKIWAVHYVTEHVELIRLTGASDEEAAIGTFWDRHEDDPAHISNVTAVLVREDRY